jgi:photosystem II stability/assembly factor-like uncharacterized protein
MRAVPMVGLGDQFKTLGTSVRDPNFIIVGTAQGKILRSIDGGGTWQEIVVVSPRLFNYGVERLDARRMPPATGADKNRGEERKALAEDRENLDYALGMASGNAHLQEQLGKKGLWTMGWKRGKYIMRKNQESHGSINWIEIDPTDDRRVYLATSDGLYRSTDKARTFMRLWQGRGKAPQRSINAVAVDPGDRKRIFVGTSNGFFLSRDWGITYKEEMNLYVKGSYIKGFYTDPQQPGLVHMATGGAAMATPDSGRTWITTHWHLWHPRSVINWIALGPNDVRLIGTNDGLFASFQGGEMGTWERRGHIFTGVSVTMALVTKDPKVWYVATPDALWRTDNSGSHWKKVFTLGGQEHAVWLSCFGGDPNKIWLLTNKQLYRSGGVKALRGVVRAKRNRRLMDIPPLYQLWLRVMKHLKIYYADNQRYRERAPLAALLPTLKLKANYGPSRNFQASKLYPYHYYEWVQQNRIDAAKFNVKVILSWNLATLIYNIQADPEYGREERSLKTSRADITARLNHLYIEYKHIARRMALAPPADPLVSELQMMRLQEISAYFNALSGGFWSKAGGLDG